MLMNKRIFKGVSLSLAFILVMGSFVVLQTNSKANFENDNVYIENNHYNDEFIQEFRKDGVDITITSLNDLYIEFDKHKNIDESVRNNILAKTADDVILQFLLEEQCNFFEINEDTEDINVFSEQSEENSKKRHKNFIKNIETTYYQKGEDSLKKVTTISTIYGSNFEKIVIDEPENNSSRGIGKYTKIDKPYNELIFKDYGKRKFSYTVKDTGVIGVPVFNKITCTFGYTLEYGRIEARYIKHEIDNMTPGLRKYELDSETILTSVSENINDTINAEVIINVIDCEAAAGGLCTDKIKINMSVKQLADANHPTITGMRIQQCAQAYQKTLGAL